MDGAIVHSEHSKAPGQTYMLTSVADGLLSDRIRSIARYRQLFDAFRVTVDTAHWKERCISRRETFRFA